MNSGTRWSRAPAIGLFVLLSACAHLPEHPGLPSVSAPLPGDDSPLDRMFSADEAQHAGESGFRLVIEGMEAFVLRMHSARLATRSLDVQTYIWHADATGLYLAQQALQAADRGVQVRLLVDDMDARANNTGFAAITAHPNVEVRLFNPFASRSGGVRLASEGARDFGRINHRMHNKSWIADNRIALVGGRNLGDEYFGASDELNFVDLDFAMVGPVVRDVSASFDHFWNSSAAWPMELLDPDASNAEALSGLRARLEERTSSLHTKALTADGKTLFVGSYNLDPRSTWLNTEQGVLVEDATLAAQLSAIFGLETSGNRAWHVTLEDGELRWADGKETLDGEPHATLSQRFQAWLARLFHLDAQL